MSEYTGMDWPPTQWQQVFTQMQDWASWWANEPNTPRRISYTVTTTQTPARAGRGFFRDRNRNKHQNTTSTSSRGDLTIPVAGDLARTAADIIYGRPPVIDADNGAAGIDPTAQRVQTYVDNGLFDELLTGVEIGSIYGGRYHAVTIDTSISDAPFLTTITPDQVIPQFRWGHLTGATVFHLLPGDVNSQTQWWHVETHYLANGYGRIRHELYQGTSSQLGQAMPLTDHPYTAPLAEIVNENGDAILPDTPGLFIHYFPNITPQRKWRNHPQAVHYGRSDIEDLTSLFDALNETWSSWMRDLRLGKARVLIARDLLEQDDEGGMFHDLDREVLTPLSGLIPDTAGSMPMQPIQFNIRVQEHQATVTALIEQIIRAAGYSQATFGENQQDAQITATEIRAREKRTISTRNRKLQLEGRVLKQLLQKMLTVDTALGTPGLNPDGLKVTFPNFADETTAELTDTAIALKSAQLASLQTALEMAHPDWEPDQIQTEIDQIQHDTGLSPRLESIDEWQPPTHDTVTPSPVTGGHDTPPASVTN